MAIFQDRDEAERCARCGHSWYEHTWHVYTECLICGLDCRYYVPPLSAAEAAACRERLAALVCRRCRFDGNGALNRNERVNGNMLCAACQAALAELT